MYRGADDRFVPLHLQFVLHRQGRLGILEDELFRPMCVYVYIELRGYSI